MAEQEKAQQSQIHNYYFGEPSAAVLGAVRGGIGGGRLVATYCDCSTCACGSCACNCSCNACGACYCDCSCKQAFADRFDITAIASLLESFQAQMGEIRQIAASLKERK